MKKLFSNFAIALVALMMFTATSCSDSKDLVIDGQTVEVEPYGWADAHAVKRDDVVYKPVVGNIVWSVILSQTIVAPVVLTGWYIMEPVSVKESN